MEIDKECLIKAAGICCLSWGALPIIYAFLKKNKEIEKLKDDQKN